MANKNLMSGHRGAFCRSQGPVSLHGPSVGHRYILSYTYILFLGHKSPISSHKDPLSDHKGPLRVQKSPLLGHETPCKAIRASIGPQESGHKGPLASYNGPILSHKSHYRVTRHLLVVHRPSVRTSNRATKTTCRPPRLSFGPLGFLIGTPGSLSG